MSDRFVNIRIRAVDGREFQFAPGTHAAVGDWIASLIAAGVLQTVGGWLIFEQRSP